MAKIEHIQPEQLFDSSRFGFSQVVSAAPGRLVFVSGQTSMAADGSTVGAGDLEAQARQALTNLGHALRAAGATPADVTMCRAYIVDLEPKHLRTLGGAFAEFSGGGPPPASTWVGVTGLAGPDYLIEIEAIAVVS